MDTGDCWRASYSKSPLPHHCLATHFQHCATYPWASASSPLGLKLSALCFPSSRFPVVNHYATSHSWLASLPSTGSAERDWHRGVG